MKKTSKGTKKFMKSEKLLILSEGKKNGVKKTLDEYALYPGIYYYWKKKLTVYSESGLKQKKSKEDQGFGEGR